jgi:hypothetical protein
MWTSNELKQYTFLKQVCSQMGTLHLRASSMYKKRDRILGFVVMVLGTVVTTTLFMQLDSCSFIQQLISGILSSSLTLLTSISDYLNYKKKSSDHLNISSEFIKLLSLDQLQISFSEYNNQINKLKLKSLPDKFIQMYVEPDIFTPIVIQTIHEQKNQSENQLDEQEQIELHDLELKIKETANRVVL